MVQMETQLQSIFEEVVVSGRAGDPGRRPREEESRELRVRTLPRQPLLCCDTEDVCRGLAILKLLSDSAPP